MLNEQMKEAQKCSAAIYMKFVNNYQQYPNTLFCFYEGEDEYYYGPRVKTSTKYSDEQIIDLSCNGKDGVISVYNSIKKNVDLPDDINTLYFIDKDYGFNSIKDSNVYETSTYSIESFYCSIDAVRKMIMGLFNINKMEMDEVDKILKLFAEKYEIYKELIIPLNAYLYSIREYEKINKISKRANFKLIKDSNIYKNKDFDNFEMRKFDMEYYKKILAIDYDIEEISFNKNKIYFMKENSNNRGKFEISFVVWFLDNIKKILKTGSHNLIKRECPKTNIESNPIFILSRYADTPDSLIKFLNKYNPDDNSEVLNKDIEKICKF